MEPTNHPFGKENDFPNLHEDMFRGVLQGCPPFNTISFQKGTQQTQVLEKIWVVGTILRQDVNPDDPEAAERFQELVAAYNSIMGHLDFPSADEGFVGDVRKTKTTRKKKYMLIWKEIPLCWIQRKHQLLALLNCDRKMLQ